MKFSEIVKGVRQDEVIELPHYIGQPPDAKPLECAVRALNDIEEERVLAAAVRRAKSQGADKAEPGDPLYDLALMVETIAIACLDKDSPTESRQPFFDKGSDQVREFFGREATALIYGKQQSYQDRVGPSIKRLGPIEYYGGFSILGGEDEREARDFFERCSVGLQWSYMRTMAVQLLSSLQPKSSSGQTSADGSIASSESQKNEPQSESGKPEKSA